MTRNFGFGEILLRLLVWIGGICAGVFFWVTLFALLTALAGCSTPRMGTERWPYERDRATDPVTKETPDVRYQ